MEVLLARQPIFDASLNVFAYELLHRSPHSAVFAEEDGDKASLEVLANTLLTVGPASVLNGRLAFVNFTRELLLRGFADLMPPEALVVEILENVEADDAVVAACRALRRRRYKLALDDVVLSGPPPALAPLASFLKVDFRFTTDAERRQIVKRYKRPGLRLLAEKVETQEEFESAKRQGFTYFQGYFFARPVMISAQAIPSLKVAMLRILSEVHAQEVNFQKLEKLLKQDVALCYRLLRYVNSAAFATRARIESVQQAIGLLGEDELRRWLTLATLPALSSDRPAELVEMALLRARLLEMLASQAGLRNRSDDLFLLGLFSLLDAMVGRPMEELLSEVGLPADVRAVLAGSAPAGARLGRLYRLALACEQGDWDTLRVLTRETGIEAGTVANGYVAAAEWCAEVIRGADAGRTPSRRAG